MGKLKELKNLISKYGDIIQFEKKASQIEKEKYYLLNRAITLEYNDYRFRHRNKIDFSISEYLKKIEKIEIVIIEETDNYLSLFSKNRFFSKSNVLNLENAFFDEFPKRIEFSSLFQFLVFNKSILFFDRKSANFSLKTNDKEELLNIDSTIENYNGTVWTEYKTEIIEKGFIAIFENSPGLLDKINSQNEYFIFKSNYENWGVIKIQNFIQKEIRKTHNFKNYLGKILTAMKIENQLK